MPVVVYDVAVGAIAALYAETFHEAMPQDDDMACHDPDSLVRKLRRTFSPGILVNRGSTAPHENVVPSHFSVGVTVKLLIAGRVPSL